MSSEDRQQAAARHEGATGAAEGVAGIAARRKGEQRRSYSTALAAGLILSVLAHFALFEFFPRFRAAQISVGARQMKSVELPPETEIPPPPEQIARPATPKVSASAKMAEDVTIAPTTFEQNPADKLPPPPKATGGEGDESKRPAFIPYDTPPKLKNPVQVRKYLQSIYPPSLKENGIGGIVTLWLYVDEKGRVQKTRLHESSGYDALDASAKKVARRMSFSPALNRDKRTAVWVQQRIRFEVK